MTLPVVILVLATLIIFIAQTMQIINMLRTHTSVGVSIPSEAVNLSASIGLLLYALFLADPALIASRGVLMALWMIRLIVAWTLNSQVQVAARRKVGA